MEAFPLPSFDGDGDLDEWLFKVQAFFDYTGKREDALMILYAANFLTGKAHAEWRNAVENGQPIHSWSEFKAFLARRFKPQPDRVETEQDKVRNFLAALAESDPCAAEYVKGKKPKSVQRVEALVKEFNTPEEKICFVCYVGDDDYGMWLRGKVKGQAVSLQFSNNSDNFISEKAVERLGLQTVRCKPYVLQSLFAGGDPKVWNTKVAELELEIEKGLRMRMDFAIVDLDRHDFIIGRELIHASSSFAMSMGDNPNIEVKKGKKKYHCPLHKGRP